MLHNAKVPDDFEVHSGVRQGCILSLLLFLMAISDVIRAEFNERTQRLKGTMISNGGGSGNGLVISSA